MSWNWAPNREKKAAGKLRTKARSAGVKHVKPTMSGFSHPEPDKAERLMRKLNLHSADPLASGGGSGKGLTGQEVCASFGLTMPAVHSVERYLGRACTVTAVFDLAFYKHTGDLRSFRGAKVASLHILVSQAIEDGWSDAKADDRPRGIMESCAIAAVVDVCNPALFADLSARRWAQILGLDSHQQWIRKWKGRYDKLRAAVQELDIAADHQIEKRV